MSSAISGLGVNLDLTKLEMSQELDGIIRLVRRAIELHP